MRTTKSLSLWLAVLLVLAGLPLTAAARPAPEAAPIEPALLQALEADGQADFFVEMAVQADLSAAPALDWAARGEVVWQALNQVARATQAPVLDLCRARALDCYSLLAANAVYVRNGTLEAALALAALPGVARLRLERVRQTLGQTLRVSETLRVLEVSGVLAVTTWGLLDTHAPDVWALGVRGDGAWVANIDTGVQWDHPALIGNYGCPLNPGDPRCWWDPANICGGTPCDNNGHGTHTMGTMAAEDDPNLPYIAGMAPDVKWIACKGCESSSCSDFALLSCGDWVLAPGGNPANRPHLVNNSWGGAGGDDWYRAVVQAWVNAGILPVFAAGGSGPSCATLGSPCDYPEVLCVTAHDQNRNPAAFASRGPGYFGHEPYTKPNISAPGVNTWSTVPTNNWANYSGTSTAAPHAGGAAALAVSGCPQLAGDVYGLIELLQDNADPPPPGNCGAPPDGEGTYTSGYGYLNALAAVQACLPEGTPGHLDKTKINGAPAARPGYYKVVFVARIRDEQGLPAAGTTVYGTWTYPDGSTHDRSALTDALGRAKLAVKEPQTGTYTFCVADVSGNGYFYDPAANTAPACRSVTVGP